MLKRLLYSAYFTLLSISPILAQQFISLPQQIDWKGIEEVTTSEGILSTLNCMPCHIAYEKGNLPVYTKSIPLNTIGKIDAKISNATFSTINNQDISALESLEQESIEPQVTLTFDRKKALAVVELIPLIKSTSGSIQQLTSFDLELNITQEPTNQHFNKSQTSTENSILNQGTFYKFRVQEEGVYRLDQTFLESLGVNTGDISMNNIRIYGNGGGMLPELAGAERVDDLLENAIQVIDNNNNNQFDEDDYILFFGESPNQWYWRQDNNTDFFEHKKHVYSDYNHYFFNFDIGQGKRITTANQPNDYNTTANSFDALAFHEEDRFNEMGTGRNWLGDQMTEGASKPFSFSFPNLVKEEPVLIRTSAAGTTNDEGATNLIRFWANNTQFEEYNLGAVSVSLESSVGRYRAKSSLVELDSDNLEVRVTYSNPGGTDGKGFIGYISLNARRTLNLGNSALAQGQLIFRDRKSVGVDNITRFDIANPASGLIIWDVTNLNNVQTMSILDGSITAPTDILRKFIAFDGSNYLTPEAVGVIESQNLHASDNPDMLIITHPSFISQAQELADFHEMENNLSVKVVDIFQVYNEFASGNQDITAIRDYVKMIYDRASDGEEIQHLLLFGDASYDYKNIKFSASNNTNFIPIYQTFDSGYGEGSGGAATSSFTYCTDDYFALLDNTDGENIGSAAAKLDISIGRFPVRNTTEANAMVDKIKHYKTTKGNWLNNITFIADDGNSNLHVEHTESHSELLDSIVYQYNIDKIYLDAFQQVAGQGGGRYPEANKALMDKIFTGTFIMNYVGHGKATGLAKEQILDIPMIQSMENKDKLPLFITATCTFSRFDDPQTTSAGEELLINPNGGAVSIVSTVRIVGANGNKRINEAFFKQAFVPMEDGTMPTLGEITRRAKNSLGSSANNFRKFALLGDPALILNYPNRKYEIVTTSIKDEMLDIANDTVKALSKVTITGKIVDESGNIVEDFNGTISPILFDKDLELRTIGNDLPSTYDEDIPDDCPYGSSTDERDEVSCPYSFSLRQSTIFKGNASVNNGNFQFTFVVPKDISYKYGQGKLSYYAQCDWTDATGWDTTVVVGGIADLVETDNTGPEVKIFLNDENFVFGGLTNEDPILLVDLSDENGINTVGTGIGHDLTAKMDEENEQEQQFILNNYYESTLDNFQEGKITYPLTDLEPGLHTLRIKAWDVFNNSGEGYTEFLVAESAEMALDNILNYPNPFIDKTNFWFEHNRPGDILNVQIQVFTISGRLVKTIQDEFLAAGSRVQHLEWDGLDEFGNKIGKGVYVYQVKVRAASDNSVVNELQKLVLLK